MESRKRVISIDVMLKGVYQGTFIIPLTLEMISDFDGEIPVLKENALTQYVENKRPSLRGKDYKIFFNE